MGWELTDGDCRRCKGEGVAPTGREPQWTVLPPCDSCKGSGKGRNWEWVEREINTIEDAWMRQWELLHRDLATVTAPPKGDDDEN